jgi:NAD(P)-dependent dehydrogenase (short-subunit alcohol dehydrogenase family)
MGKLLEGKVAIVTGAGRGLGKEEVLALAKQGCKILVNDLGASFDGSGKETKIADEVVEEVKNLGVEAVANYDSVTDFDKAKGMIQQAVDELGGLDIVVNNAGILRDRMIFNMSEEEFDAVIAVHLKGTFNMLRHAAEYFRTETKEGNRKKKSGRVINTASDAGLLGNPGQSNYGAAKAGIAAMTIIAAQELKKYATVNCIVPMARTRLTTDATPKMAGVMKKKDKSGMDVFNPANVAPMIAYLASPKARRINGEVFRVAGDKVWLFQGWQTINRIDNDGERFTVEQLIDRIPSELMKEKPEQQTLMSVAGELLGLE